MDKRKPSDVFLELWRARELQTPEAFRECAESWAEIRRMEDPAGISTPKSTRKSTRKSTPKSTPETAAKSTPEGGESTPAEEVQNGPDPVRSKAGAELRRWRKKQGLTQSQLGQKIGIPQPEVSYWETGIVPIDFAKIEQEYPMALEAFG